mmetsp:Transcript_7943/g.23935  ORF Transcript_7943/g.23935 Transcript_7943/m.23935 type:complete len:384 (-) Transcript_7943:1440-2591(-)
MAIVASSGHQLWRHVLSSEHVQTPLRSSWTTSNRLASLGDGRHFFTAAGRNVIQLKADPLPKRQCLDNGEQSSFGVADDYIVPQKVGFEVRTTLVKELSTLRSDICSVSGDSGRIAAVDGFGNVVVGLADHSGDSDGGVLAVPRSYALRPSRFEYGEEGYCGIALNSKTNSALLACARFFFKDITIYDGDISVRTFHTSGNPSAITCTSDNRIVTAEFYGLALYDMRTREGGGCTDRKTVGSGRQYAIDSQDELLACAGADRVVRVFDLRMALRPLGQWNNCLKYECTEVFLRPDRSSCFVSGIDNEVSCGRWTDSGIQGRETSSNRDNAAPVMVSGALARSPKRLFGFRGDSPWVGNCVSGDALAGITTNGAFYLFRENLER